MRELEFSKITLRLVDKESKKDSSDDHTVAKLTGDTYSTLQRILVLFFFPFLFFSFLFYFYEEFFADWWLQYTPTELALRSDNGEVHKVVVSARYIPVHMKLDPSESINNMGTLRVNVLDAAELPSADRNGFSDPYCKFHIDDKEVFKTKVQKKTLHPAWNEFFETPIKSRTGSKFRVDVYDWDFGDSADYLGGTPIDMTELEPFQNKEFSLPLDGKSGAIRLRLLFKPSYVMRSRQGSSTFSGTFATPGKIVGAPVKGVGFVGGNVIRGASFLKHGIKSRFTKNGDDAALADIPDDAATETTEVPSQVAPSSTAVDENTPPPSSSPSVNQQQQAPHQRTRSTTSHFGDRLGIGAGAASKGESGTASITVVSASGYPSSAHVRVVVKALGPKGSKDVHKTKAIKPSNGMVQYDQAHETCRIHNTTADAQYQIRVVDHSMFGSDDVLGETLFFVNDQGSVAGQEKSVQLGEGTVSISSNFVASDTGSLRPSTAHSNTGDTASEVMDAASTNSPKPPNRRSFLGKRNVSGA